MPHLPSLPFYLTSVCIFSTEIALSKFGVNQFLRAVLCGKMISRINSEILSQNLQLLIRDYLDDQTPTNVNNSFKMERTSLLLPQNVLLKLKSPRNVGAPRLFQTKKMV